MQTKKKGYPSLNPNLELNPNCNPSSNPNINPNPNLKSTPQLTTNDNNLKHKKVNEHLLLLSYSL